MEWKKR